MKRALFLVAVLFLMSTMTWAQGAGTAPAPVADPRVAGSGNCQLPDLAGLSPGQVAVAAMGSGLKLTYVDDPTVPACPVAFNCNSITGCGQGPVCSLTSLGPCCSEGGAILCCQGGGDIIETQCACRCTATLCVSTCTQHHQVSVNCTSPQ
jgi:hypothetical protein